MSASREKKQRTASTGSGLTDKQRREAAQNSKAKTKTVFYSVIGVVVAVLVILLILWNNGMFTKGKVVATVGGEDYTVAQFGYYYYPNARMYQQYGLSLNAETVESLRQSALESLHQFAATAAAAKSEGRTLSDEGLAGIDDAIIQIKSYAAQQNSTFSAYIRNVYGPYMNEATLRGMLEMDTLAREYYASYADPLTYTEEQIDGYYTEHAADLDSFTYSAAFFNGTPATATDAEGETVAPTDAETATAMSVAKAAAEKLASDGKSGDFDTLAEAATAEDDKSTLTSETTALGSALSSSLNADCKTWLTDSARKSGDTTTIEVANQGYWVLKFDRRFLDEDAWGDVDVRHILVMAEVAEGAEEPTTEAMDTAKAKAQDILDQFNAGGKTAEDFAALALEYSEDPGSKDNGGLYEHVTQSSTFFDGFKNWVLDNTRKPSDTGLVENTQSGQQGWHVMYLDKQNELQWRYTAINALKSADLSTWTEGIKSEYTIESNEANLALVK